MKTLLAQRVGKMLVERDMTIAIAESCTGGFLCSLITDIPGSSRYFKMGVIFYSNESKKKLLGVKAHTLRTSGAVSAQTAKEMAEGIRRKMAVSIGMGITGIAGPDGGTKEKPVGTLHIAMASKSKTSVFAFFFPRKRRQFKKIAAMTALDLLQKYLKKGEK